ncbi:MAG: hypothetical protein R2706_08820 [Acidimicrobiales bacterium]
MSRVEVDKRIQNRLRRRSAGPVHSDAAFLALLTTDSDADQLTIIADRLRHKVAIPRGVRSAQLISFTASVTVAAIDSKRPSMERITAPASTPSASDFSTGGNQD